MSLMSLINEDRIEQTTLGWFYSYRLYSSRTCHSIALSSARRRAVVELEIER